MESLEPLAQSSLDRNQQQAGELPGAWTAGDPDAIGIVRNHHPGFLDDRVPWPVAFTCADAQFTLVRWYHFPVAVTTEGPQAPSM